ncbi:hypothetical protein GOBAR_AA21821 [Gossypium barbadense]|uniref:Uncharacterized protein n=1 Tax=Gossypium barbadense TaxID=3634 RepID=A0A2P5X685_GOSBA|nr:hypothetical protein GOBAR_AA21821 [Gossypium barbadense]
MLRRGIGAVARLQSRRAAGSRWMFRLQTRPPRPAKNRLRGHILSDSWPTTVCMAAFLGTVELALSSDAQLLAAPAVGEWESRRRRAFREFRETVVRGLCCHEFVAAR